MFLKNIVYRWKKNPFQIIPKRSDGQKKKYRFWGFTQKMRRKSRQWRWSTLVVDPKSIRKIRAVFVYLLIFFIYSKMNSVWKTTDQRLAYILELLFTLNFESQNAS